MSSGDRNEQGHLPVLLQPVLAGLNIRPGGCYIDGTFGRGGHSREILKLLDEGGRLLAIDRDPQAVASVDPLLGQDRRFEIVRGEIADVGRIAAERDVHGNVNGLLLDLGVSSPQLDEAERGFSFRADGPLDMRMDRTGGISAAEWLATVGEDELKKVLFRFGEEKQAGRIARAIVRARAQQPITRTSQLAELVAGIRPSRTGRIHPATKTFQAIRIFVNDELGQLERALEASVGLLARGGRLCIISFHSLEDRIVKRFMRDKSREPEAWRGMPDVPDELRPPLRTIGRLITASDAEVSANPRARSARLRIAERCR